MKETQKSRFLKLAIDTGTLKNKTKKTKIILEVELVTTKIKIMFIVGVGCTSR